MINMERLVQQQLHDHGRRVHSKDLGTITHTQLLLTTNMLDNEHINIAIK